MLDTVIVGGSTAGLSAVLYLGRSLRRVTLFDTGKPCNRFTHASHGFFTRDNVPPTELLHIGREQLARYATVSLQTGRVTTITAQEGAFTIEVEGQEAVMARKVLLATGIHDDLPPIPGIEALWGRSVFHCPYCDGWENRNQPVAIHGKGESAIHIARLIRNLTADLFICTDGPTDFSDLQRERLEAHGIQIIETPIARLTSEGDQLQEIIFTDGFVLPRHALFIRPTLSQHSPLAMQLGCAFNEGGLVQVNNLGQTTVAGVYAAGDMTMPMRQLISAAASGATAAAGINSALVAEDFA